MSTALYMYTIYEKPRDFPDSFVVREWEIRENGDVISGGYTLAPSLTEARKQVPGGRYRLDRTPDDDRNIVETWV